MDYQGDTGGGGNYSGGGGGFDGGGGGYNAGGGGGSQSRARKSYDEQTLIPVTAKMILEAQSTSNAEGTGSLTLVDGRELHNVKFVGAVRSSEDFSTNVTFGIEDGTGLVDVKQWLDVNDCTAVAEMRQECLQENIYVKIVGQVKDYDGKKTLVAHTVRKLTTSNELTYHMLEVVYSAERFQKKDSIVGGGIPMNTTSGGVGFGAGVSFGGGAPVAQATSSGHDDLKSQVLNYIRQEGGRSLKSRCMESMFQSQLIYCVLTKYIVVFAQITLNMEPR
jgi:replication factor A2